MRRPVLAAVLAIVGLALLIGGWMITGWQSTRAEARAVRRAPQLRAERLASQLSGQLGARLETLAAREDQRPYYHYRNLFHDPRGATSGQSVNPSPLATGNPDRLVATNYQIDARGRLTIPTINEDVPALSAVANLADNRKLLASLRVSAKNLGRPGSAPPQQRAQPSQVIQLPQGAYLQNASPNSVYQQLQTRAPKAATRTTPRRGSSSSAASDNVRIVTRPFQWRTVSLADRETLVALRDVTTPDGSLVQGFVVAASQVQRWLDERTPDELPARWTRDADQGIAAPVSGIGDGWRVAVDARAAIAAAGARAADIERGFWWRLLPASAMAMVCFGLIVLMVARSDRLARERSRFAAAAAHELRTPLAGLQLYGDMLADDLGDRTRKAEYAKRVSEEAARLGRVVGNVLGFTQLERGRLSVEPRPGDAVVAVERALDRNRSVLEHAGMTVDFEAPETAPATFDEDAVGRILQNLLDNAEKYSRDLDERSVKVTVEGGDGATITVIDDGPGIAPHFARHLFTPFRRGTDDEARAGLGLGLAMARALAEAQGGRLVHVPGERGARFELHLPA
jgi:signal transduction histidine kinase